MNLAFLRMRNLVLPLLALGCAANLLAQSQDAPKKTEKTEQPKPVPGSSFDRNQFVKKYDKNGDGKLDEKEREAARKDRQAEFVKKYDKNGDGKLDDVERKAAREEFLKSRESASTNAAKVKIPDSDKKPVEGNKQSK